MGYNADEIHSRLGYDGRGISIDEVLFLVSDSRSSSGKCSAEDIKRIGDANPLRRFATTVIQSAGDKHEKSIEAIGDASELMTATDAWCKRMEKLQVDLLRSKKWSEKDIKTFLDGCAKVAEVKNRMGRDYPIDPDWEPQPDDSYQNILRSMYKFKKKKKVMY